MRPPLQAWTGLLTLILVAGACAGPQPPAEPAPREIAQYTIEQFLDTTSYSGASFSPDNQKVLVSSNETGIFNVYALPTAGGEPEALTDSSAESIFAMGYFPADERFLYTADKGGNELNHLYVRELDGSTTDLTPGDELKAIFLGWAQDDASFFVGTNERDQRYFDVYEHQAGDYQRAMIYQNDEGLDFGAISPDRRFIALSKTVTNADTDLYLYDRESGEVELLTPREGDVNYYPQTFSVDGTGLYALTDEDSEFTYLVRYDLESRQRETVEEAAWDIAFSYFSKHGTYRVTGVNNDGRTELRLYDGATGEPRPLPEVADAEIGSVSFSRDETRMAFYASTSRTPRDLYVLRIDGGSPTRLTDSLNPAIDSADLVDAEVVRFASFDGQEVPGILYRPHQATAESPAPALVWVHGGPGGQSRVGYSALIQYLVNHGYVVYAINNRGSSGYGKTFFHLDDRAHGEGDLQDCVASKQMLIDTGYVEAEKIGILGGSYGGFMVLAALAFEPEAFAVGVDIFGVANWLRTLQSIPPWWESFRAYLEKEMGDFDDETYLRSISPLFHADQITRPLMVLQGANDPRVLKAESDDIVAAVQKNGVPVEYLVFDDEGHGFLKKENQEEGYRAILAFLDTYLLGEGIPEVAAEPVPVG